MGIVLAQTRLPLTEAWTSRFLAGGAIGAVMAPWLVGELLKKHPAALGWSEVVFILLQVVAYVSVALMPRLRSPADAVSEEEWDAEVAYAAGTSASSSLATGAAEAKPTGACTEPATAARGQRVGAGGGHLLEMKAASCQQHHRSLQSNTVSNGRCCRFLILLL